jgi:hypothetical protein
MSLNKDRRALPLFFFLSLLVCITLNDKIEKSQSTSKPRRKQKVTIIMLACLLTMMTYPLNSIIFFYLKKNITKSSFQSSMSNKKNFYWHIQLVCTFSITTQLIGRLINIVFNKNLKQSTNPQFIFTSFHILLTKNNTFMKS